MSLPAAEAVLHRLLRRAPSHLAASATSALVRDVLPLVGARGGGGADLALLLATLAALADAPARDRLDLSYKLLMWRSVEPGAQGASRESPATRGDLVDLLSVLKVVYEAQHNQAYLAPRQPRGADAQYVTDQRFAADIAKHFGGYEALPLLCNPLS